jgi:hypothetical protein
MSVTMENGFNFLVDTQLGSPPAYFAEISESPSDR